MLTCAAAITKGRRLIYHERAYLKNTLLSLNQRHWLNWAIDGICQALSSNMFGELKYIGYATTPIIIKSVYLVALTKVKTTLRPQARTLLKPKLSVSQLSAFHLMLKILAGKEGESHWYIAYIIGQWRKPISLVEQRYLGSREKRSPLNRVEWSGHSDD